jgi:hypothetical protein
MYKGGYKITRINELYESYGIYKQCFTCKFACKANGNTLSLICPRYEKEVDLLNIPLEIMGNDPINRNRQLRRIITYLKELRIE